MRQETGKTNSFRSTDKVSIQLVLDGHSFSPDRLPREIAAGTSVEIELLTARTTLVPAELFDTDSAAALLAAAGIAVAAGEQPVWSTTEGEIVALMVIDRESLRTLRARFGERLHFTTPLLAASASQTDGPTVEMLHTHDILYIKVSDAALQLAEAVPVASESELLYLCERLHAEFPTERYTLRLAGTMDKRWRSLLRARFKQVVCVS